MELGWQLEGKRKKRLDRKEEKSIRVKKVKEFLGQQSYFIWGVERGVLLSPKFASPGPCEQGGSAFVSFFKIYLILIMLHVCLSVGANM